MILKCDRDLESAQQCQKISWMKFSEDIGRIRDYGAAMKFKGKSRVLEL